MGRRLGSLSILLLLGMPLTGCLEWEVRIEVAEDLSGRYRLEARFFGNDELPLDRQRVEDFRALHLKGMREELEADLPPGVTLELLELSYLPQELVVSLQAGMRFDDLSRLQEMGTSPGSPLPSGFRLSEEEDAEGYRRLTLSLPLSEEGRALVPEGGGEMRKLLADRQVQYTIDLPGEIVEHDADEREGNRLSWRFPLNDLVFGDARELRVTFRVPKEE